MIEMNFNATLMKLVAATTRQRIMMELEAFCNDNHIHFHGMDVIPVEGLLEFMKTAGVIHEQEGQKD